MREINVKIEMAEAKYKKLKFLVEETKKTMNEYGHTEAETEHTLIECEINRLLNRAIDDEIDRKNKLDELVDRKK